MSSDEQRIDRLQSEAGIAGDNRTLACTRSFLPVVGIWSISEENGGLSEPARHSSPMIELVARGAAAVPALLNHLTDSRPTRLTIETSEWRALVFGDGYFSRYREPRRQPHGVNTESWPRISGPTAAPRRSYTFRVGDLCYVALGQIVNRPYTAFYGPIGMDDRVTLFSPVEKTALAEAARADWRGLTRLEHERGLCEDLFALSPGFTQDEEAWDRLLYYYPTTARKLAFWMLARPLYDWNGVDAFLEGKLVPAAPGHWEQLMKRFRRTRGKTAYRGLLARILYGRALYSEPPGDPQRDREVRIYDQLLRRFFPAVDPWNPGSLNASDSERQSWLVAALSGRHWPGLDQAVYRVFRRVAAETPSNVSERLSASGLAMHCSARLLGKGHDEEFRAFFTRALRQTQDDLAEARRTASHLPAGNAGWSFALGEHVDELRALLKRLHAHQK